MLRYPFELQAHARCECCGHYTKFSHANSSVLRWPGCSRFLSRKRGAPGFARACLVSHGFVPPSIDVWLRAWSSIGNSVRIIWARPCARVSCMRRTRVIVCVICGVLVCVRLYCECYKSFVCHVPCTRCRGSWRAGHCDCIDTGAVIVVRSR